MKVLTYKVRLTEEPEGGFTVTVPALPGCVTYGENEEEALSMVKEAIVGYIAVLKEKGDPIPDDSKSKEFSITIKE